MDKPNIEWVGSPNFSSRLGRKPLAIVDHITQGLFPGCMDWGHNPISGTSPHYIVTKTGRILQLVREGDKAWHAGIVNKPNWVLYDGTNPNNYTIGIEHEGFTGEALTEPQYQSSLCLHRQIIERWGMPIDSDHIIGHYRINSVDRANCPGAGFPWNRLFKDLEGGGNDVLGVAVLLFSKEDYWSGTDVAAKNGNCAMFIRPADRSVHPEAMSAKKLIVIGGPTTGHPGEVLLSGHTKYDTAAAVAKYLG